MEVYKRIVDRVRGALWAHHRRLLSERQAQRILAYVYNNKYEYQMRFDTMTVVGRAHDGQVEVATTPAGHVRRVRVSPAVTELTTYRQEQLVLAAYADACAQGRALMAQAELRVYKQFLADVKPLILGIRDNPEFYTVPEDAVETPSGVLHSMSSLTQHNNNNNSSNTRSSSHSSSSHKATSSWPLFAPRVYRTIPAAKAHEPVDAVRRRLSWEARWLQSAAGKQWARTLRGKEYLARYHLEARPRGAPGGKARAQLPLQLSVPYAPMDEERLLRRNWVAFLDNKHVAETLWTRSAVASREKALRALQESGQAWHRPVNNDAEQQPT